MWQCIHHLFLAITPFIYIFNRYQGRTGQGGGGVARRTVRQTNRQKKLTAINYSLPIFYSTHRE